jgi:hypothetical protein
MSALTPSIRRQNVVAGPTATALAVVLGLAMLIAGAFAFGGRGTTAPGAVHSVPEPNAAAREGGPATNAGIEQFKVRSVPEPNSAAREGGPATDAGVEYTPLSRVTAK